MEPPVAVTETALPVADAATGLTIWIKVEVLEVPGESVTATAAIVPLLIRRPLMPTTTQVWAPAAPPHETDFPAAVAAAPGVT